MTERTRSVAEFTPFVSVTLRRVRSGAAVAPVLSELLDHLTEALGLDEEGGTRRLVQRGEPTRDGPLTVGFLHYEEERAPTWARETGIRDVLNQLVLVCRFDRYVAVFLSDARQASRLLPASGRKGALGWLEPITPGVMNAAFVDGPARTLWLSGIHRHTTVKADSKVLIGSDLRDALDPLGDQSFYFTAARCQTGLAGANVVGSAPRRSKAWAGPARDWQAFRDAVVALLRRVQETYRRRASEAAPLPVLAVPLVGAPEVQDAFDVGVRAPEALGEALDEDTQGMLERWAYESSFEVVNAAGASFTARLRLGEEEIGELSFAVDVSDPDRVRWDVSLESTTPLDDLAKEALRICRNHSWLQIRYESGHTLSEGAIYSLRYRDMPFRGWRFVDLSGYDVRKEKPVVGNRFEPAAIGKQDSLFCWVWNTWLAFDSQDGERGWLVCDDGSMEIADFIHLDDAATPPVLSLVHVKGSHNSGRDRGISVSDYEVVVGQAVKNLRHLDRLLLAEGLEAGLDKKIGAVVRRAGGAKHDRRGMLRALDALGDDYARRVVIVQPRVTALAHRQAGGERRAGKATGTASRLRQLDALLLGAEADCHELGAVLLVLGDGTPEGSK